MKSVSPPSPAAQDVVVRTVHSSYLAIGQPRSVLCAFSGGADSTALLCALVSLRSVLPFDLSALHVHHGLRENADRDETFCADLCQRFCIPFRSVRLSLRGKSEDEARRARYRALLDHAVRTGADVVALAHHAQDQAETVLMRLMRGTVSGIGGMEVLSGFCGQERVRLWRPLLALLPETLRAFLGRRGQSWVEDETNEDRSYLRNLIRHDVLGPMRDRAPACVTRIACSAGILGEESRYLDALAARLLEGNARVTSPCACIRAPVLYGAPPVLLRRCLRLFLVRWKHCEMPGMDQIIHLSRLGVGESCSIGGGCRALRTESYLHFFPPHPPSLPLVPLRALPNPGRLSGDGVRFQAIPKRLFSEAVLRPSAREDRIVPFGAEYTKPLRAFLSARGTEPSFRPYYPVLALGSEVIWVPGAGAGEKARVRPEEESVALYYPGFLPGDMDEAVPESADTEV